MLNIEQKERYIFIMSVKIALLIKKEKGDITQDELKKCVKWAAQDLRKTDYQTVIAYIESNKGFVE